MRNSLLIILLFSFSITSEQTDPKSENYKPVNLEEAVEQLRIINHDSTKQQILEMTEDDFFGGAHFVL